MEHIFHISTHKGIRIRCGKWESFSSSKRGTILLLNGRTEFLEKYSEVIQEFNTRGFDVLSFDWRGQGLSSRLLPIRTKGFVNSFEDYLEDLKSVMVNVAVPNSIAPIICVGHSMGGHLALRYLYKHQNSFHRAILVSPMIGINTFPLPFFIAKKLFELAIKFGMETKTIFGTDHTHSFLKKFNGNPLTSDPKRFYRVRNLLLNQPDLIVGGVTIGWLYAAFESIDITMKYEKSKIRIPILMIGGANDHVVSVKAMCQYCRSLPNCNCQIIPRARHELFLETDDIRKKLWESIDLFLWEISHVGLLHKAI